MPLILLISSGLIFALFPKLCPFLTTLGPPQMHRNLLLKFSCNLFLVHCHIIPLCTYTSKCQISIVLILSKPFKTARFRFEICNCRNNKVCANNRHRLWIQSLWKVNFLFKEFKTTNHKGGFVLWHS